MIEQLRALFSGPRLAVPASEASEPQEDFLDWMQQSTGQESDTPPDTMALFLQQFGLPAQPLPVKMATAALVGIEDIPQPAPPDFAPPEGDLLAAFPLLAPVNMTVPDAPPPQYQRAAPPMPADLQSTPSEPIPQDAIKLPVLDQSINVISALLDSAAALTVPVQSLAEPLMKSIATPPGLPADPTLRKSPVQQQLPAAEIVEPEVPPLVIAPASAVVAVLRPDRAAPMVAPELPTQIAMPAQIVVTEFVALPPKPRRDLAVKDAEPRALKHVDLAPATPDSEPVLGQFTQTSAVTEQPDPQQSEQPPLDVQTAPAQTRTADQPRPPLAAPANLTGQLLHHAATAIERQVEVVLTPEELGRVKFQIRHNGDSVSILLTAERVDTMEMLKRHGEELMREFRQAGFAGATLDFGRWGQQPQSQQHAPASFTMAEDFALTPTPPRPVPPASHASAASGLNIRL